MAAGIGGMVLLGSPMVDATLDDTQGLRAVIEILKREMGHGQGTLKVEEDGPQSSNRTPWAQCDLCRKWRRMPWHVDPGRMLGDSWVCRQNTWDPERASCDVPEEKAAEEMAVEFAGSSVVKEEDFERGMWIDAHCTRLSRWFPARVIQMDEKRVQIHYHKLSKKNDEWIDKVDEQRIQRVHTYTKPIPSTAAYLGLIRSDGKSIYSDSGSDWDGTSDSGSIKQKASQAAKSLQSPESDYVYYGEGGVVGKSSMSREERTKARLSRVSPPTVPIQPPRPSGAGGTAAKCAHEEGAAADPGLVGKSGQQKIARPPKKKLGGAAKMQWEKKRRAEAAAAAAATAAAAAAAANIAADYAPESQAREASGDDLGNASVAVDPERAVEQFAEDVQNLWAAKHLGYWSTDGGSAGAVAAAAAAVERAAALLRRGEMPIKRDEAERAKALLSDLATAFHPSPSKAGITPEIMKAAAKPGASNIVSPVPPKSCFASNRKTKRTREEVQSPQRSGQTAPGDERCSSSPPPDGMTNKLPAPLSSRMLKPQDAMAHYDVIRSATPGGFHNYRSPVATPSLPHDPRSSLLASGNRGNNNSGKKGSRLNGTISYRDSVGDDVGPPKAPPTSSPSNSKKDGARAVDVNRGLDLGVNGQGTPRSCRKNDGGDTCSGPRGQFDSGRICSDDCPIGARAAGATSEVQPPPPTRTLAWNPPRAMVEGGSIRSCRRRKALPNGSVATEAALDTELRRSSSAPSKQN